MNKVFRVIWSQATQSWVAVSELTKAHKKQSSSNAQKSAVKFSGNFIKSAAIALTLLSGHSAYAADAASGLIQINSTGTATASGSESIAVGKDSKATSDTAVAIGKDAEASGKQSVALGNKAKATGENSYAIGWGSNASHPRSISIGYNSAARHNNSLALGYNTIASGPSSVALGAGSNALGDDSYAIGYSSKTNTGANFAMAFGNSSKANKANDIAFGREAGTRDQGQGHSIAIGYGAMSGTNNAGKNLNGGDAGGVAIGTGAYTGVNQTDGRSVNSSVAVGAGAGAGFRKLDASGMPDGNATDVDNNVEVLKKAFGVKNVEDYQPIAKGINGYTNVAINEGTALGRNARAIGDQSIAIGAQTIAGMGAVALGGNDITQFANNKYYKSTKENFAATETEDHNQDAEISKDTISGAYNRLVGTKLDTKYKATYAQDGSVVLGAQAHSGTPLGTALGTNALVRKGAFGATAIGAGSQVQANAEAAVAIGMGSFANGKYAVAAGTAAKAEESAVAAGYQANADKSAVAVGDHSKAVEASVAVGQGAQAKNVADIAIGQGAVASGKQGAIAMGLGTNAQGDSSIMIGGADVDSASKQSTTFEKAIGVNEKGGVIAKDVVEKINGKEVTRHYTFAATKTTTGTVAAAFQELTGHAMDVAILNFADTKNKNGHASTSLGVHSLAKGDLATAIGASARADVIGSLALGTGAHATLQNAVAIGTGSTTELLGTRQLSVNYDSEGNIVSDTETDKIAYTFKWAGGTNTSEGDVVSFGSSGAERQLKNVAAGRVAEDSTDAINGSQLNSITKKIAAGFNTSGNVVTGSSGEFTSKKANTDSADKAYETAIRSQDKVQLQVGNNLKLDRDETEVEIEVQDDFDKTKTVKKKVKKADFAYSLNPVLTNLTSAEFKADGKPTVNISSDGITITPAAPTTGGEQKPNVSLTENGLNNGGNTITNVAGNLNGAKKDTDAPKTNAAAPNTTDKNGDKYINPNNAATVGDVLNAGWNLQGNGTAKDFVTAYDIVNFIDGEGTSVSVENTDNKTSKIKYSVNLGDGLEKDDTTNKIKAKAGNGVTVGADGIKVNTGKGLKIDAANGSKVAVDTDDETITVGTDGKVKAVTGSTETVTDTNKGTDEKAGQVRPVKADKGKLATVDAVANAVNNAAWSITSGTDGGSFATSGHTKTTEKISAGGSVTFKAGDNLIIKQAGTDFTYSLNPILSGLTSAEFKGTGKNAPTTKLTNAGITITSATTGKNPVSLTEKGLNNGSNAITNVAGNLDGAKTGTNAPTTSATKPTLGTADNEVNSNNAATVSDVLNAGWNLQGNNAAKDFVTAYDTVNFIDGDGTTVSVENTDNKTSTIKYSVNLGDGLEKDTATNKIKAKAGKGVSVDSDGIKVDTGKGLKIDTADGKKVAVDADDKTITVGTDGKVKAVTGSIEAVTDTKGTGEKAGQVRPVEADKGKLATVDAVANAVNSAKWMAKATNTDAEIADNEKTNDGTKAGEGIAAGDEVTFTAGKNLRVKRDGKNFTFATDKDVSFDSVKVGAEDTAANGKKPVNLTTGAATSADNNQTGKAPTTALNISSGTGKDAKPTQITGVGSVLNTTTVTSAPDGIAPATQPKLVNLGTAHNQTALADNVLNSAATVRDLANMGWKISSDKATGADGKAYSDVVRNADEVRFVGKNAAKVSGKTDPTTGIRTITVDVEVPDVKTAELVSSKDGSVIAPSTNPDLQKALKDAKDKLAALPNTATEAEKEAAEKKVKDAETALNKALDDKGVATAKNVADMINASGFTLKTSATADGKKESGNDEVITSGKAVEMIAGKNLTVKQEANGKVTYSLNPELSNLTSAEFKGTGTNAPTTKLTNAGITITPVTTGKNPVSLTENGLNNGGNAITNVAGNLEGAKTGTDAPTTSATAPTVGTGTGEVNKNNAATVGDVLNAGWNLQGNNTAKDFVTAYDTVNFVDGDGTTVSVENTDNKTSTIKYSVNLGDGLEKDATTNKIKVKAADKSLEVTNGGVKVKTADNTLTTDAKGLKVNTGNITASSVPTVAEADKGKIATVDNVAEAIKAAAWKATSDKTANGENSGKKDQEVKAGDTVTFEADKNIKIAQADGKFTFSTKDNVEFNSVQLGGNTGPKLTKTDGNDLKVSGSNGTDPVKITNVADGNISADSKDAINGSQFNAVANNNIKLGGDNKSETNGQSLNKAGGMKFNINGANGIETEASGDSVTVKINTETKAKIDSVDDKADKNLSNITADGETKIKNLVTWKAKASNSGKELAEGEKTADSDTDAQKVGADGVLTLDAGKNLLLKRSEKTFTYALSKTLSDLTSAEFKTGDVTTKINGDGLTIQAPTPAGGTAPKAITVNKDGISAGDKAITDVNSGLTNYGGTDAKKDLINLGNSSTGSKVPGNNAATVGNLRNMGWVVSSDKTTDKTTGNTDSPYSEAVKNADEVKFVGKHAAKVSGKTDPTTGIRTITVDVEVPDVKTAKLVSSTDGSVIAPSTNSKLQEELKTAKDKLAALPNTATEAEKEAAEKKVKDAETALNNTVDDKGVATAKNVADMINASGFTLKTSATADGKKDAASTGDEVITPGKAVEMVAGKNLTVKQEANGKVTYSTKDNVEFTSVKVGEDKDGKKPVNFTTDKATDASNNDAANKPTTALNISSGTGADAKPTQLKGVGSTLNTQDIATAPQGKGNTNKPNVSLVNLVGTDKAPVNKNAAATVGDLQNMGWVVSTKDGNGYTDVVKNANQVDFKGTGLATVTGETKDGIRTITVNVDAQKAVEAAQTPVVYTNKAGDKLVKVGDKFYKAGDVVNGKPKENAQEVPKGDVIASMNNGDNNTNKPMQLANIGSNLPTVNDTSKQAFDPNSTTPKTDKNNKSAPMTAAEAAELLNPTSNKFAGNNAATVSDVLNAGWNLQGNGSAVDFVKPFDTVNFVNGKGTKAVVETADNLTSTVKFDVDAVEITAETKDGKATGKVVGPTTQELKDALEAAKKEAEANPADEAKKKALKDAQSKVDAANNQVATAQNVADMINNSGFTLKTSATAAADNLTADNTLKNDGEVINPGKTVEMVAGKNLTVKQEKNGKVTYSTKDDVSFNTVNVGDNTYVDKNGKPVTKDGDKYKDAEGNPVDAATVTKLSPVAMKAEKAKPATNNGNEAKDQPTTALNVSSSDGKPTQITGVGSTLNVKPVDTNTNGTPTADADKPNLVDLVDTKDAPVNKNAAATVGDLQNMGWVVSTKDGNGYKDVVKNANQVDFKGGAGISVKGKTTDSGIREITISIKDGEVVKPNQFTAKVNGTDTPVTKVGDKYYNTADIDPKTGNPKDNVTPVTPDAGTTPTNAGDGYVTGNKVAAAIQKSGFVVGKQKDALSAADFKDEVEDEKVNPDDELRFADGNNTKVKLATKKSVDKDGNKVTTTTVKVDVTGLPVQYTDKNGTPVTKVGDQYFTVDDKGNPTATEVKPEDLTTNMVNPAAAPNVIGAPTTLGNVKSNLPSVNDADKNAKDVAGNPIAGKDNKSAPMTAAEAAELLKPTTADGKANPKFAGNNAATVSDVLNAGWNLQNNGEARDFVKPYDTVNFVNGKGTTAVVETADNLISTVKFDVDAGEITAETKDGKATGKVVGPVHADKKPADLLKAVADAQKAVDKLAKDAAATPEAKKAAQDALKAAQAAAAPLNKVATAQNVADMINASGFTLKTSATAEGKKKSGDDEIINPGKTVEMIAGKNLTVTQDKNGKVTYATANDVNFNSLSLGDSKHAPTLSADEDGSLRLGSKSNQAPVRISNVAPGIKDGDAVNVSQLKGVTKDLEDKIDGVAAGSNAAASLPQVYLPGKSMVAASVGTYGSQGALAVGYSSISDNGKWLIKGQINVNTKAKTGGGVGVGYLW